MKRAFVVSDTHFGARSNSVEWLESMFDFFYKQFIPQIKELKKEGDVLIHCGDVFDNRQSINLQVLSKTIQLFEDLSEIFTEGIYIIAGNHDIFKKKSNEICSLDSLRNIKNIHIFKESVLIKNFYDKQILFMPWVGDFKEEKDILKQYKPDYVFCHTNIQGATFDKYRKVEDGLDLKSLKINRIFCGHIHWQQQFKNVNLLGNPYQITRSDKDNKKGFWLFDFEKDVETFIENVHSPQFTHYNLKNILEYSLEEFRKIIKNNIVDIYINSEYLKKINFDDLYLKLSKDCWKLTLLPFEEENSKSLNESVEDIHNLLDLKSGFVLLLKDKKYNEIESNKHLNKFEKLYNRCI